MEHNNWVIGGKIAWDLTSYIAGGGGVTIANDAINAHGKTSSLDYLRIS